MYCLMNVSEHTASHVKALTAAEGRVAVEYNMDEDTQRQDHA